MKNNFTTASSIRNDILEFIIGIIVLVLAGAILISDYSIIAKGMSGIAIVITFVRTMSNSDFFSALMQLFVCNHFQFASYYGGFYNWLFVISLLTIFIVFNEEANFKSSFSLFIKLSLATIFLIQFLSVIAGNDFDTPKKVLAIVSFLTISFLFYFFSSIKLKPVDYFKFLAIICIVFIYLFVVSLNQKLLFITFNSPFFPIYKEDADFGELLNEIDVIRSSGTFLNYEAYAEYSLLIIALLLPGVLSGSVNKLSSTLNRICLLTIFLGVLSIILSATRSSILLLPILVLFILYNSKTIKRNFIILISIIFGIFLMVNSFFQIIDVSVFGKRSEDIDINSLSLTKILSGEQINRGPVFSLAIQNIRENASLIGGGYFTSRKEYHEVHFKNDPYGEAYEYADFHNLYLSLTVIWGFLGAFLFIAIFVSLLIKGISLHKNVKHISSIPNDLLLGFNSMLVIFLINQLKIQFNREVNYFTLILILLAFYSILIRNVSKTIKD